MRVTALFAVAMCAACYAPSPHAGAPCPDGICPSGLVCASASRTCELSDSTDSGVANHDDAGLFDAAAATTDATDAQSCFGAGLVTVCPTAPVTAPLSITSNTTIDTETSPLCVAYTGGTENAYCVIAATTISISPNRRLRAIGARPLVVLATTSITIDGTIDVSAGAASNPSACVPPTAATGSQGGAGGSYRGRGGAGGGKVSGVGPASAPATTAIAFRGGCDGGSGAGGGGGGGGNGGGAMYLAAPAITINGTLNAAGTGGGAGISASGGGGGGAGGFIGLDAPAVSVASGARIFANGGGGGEGATPNHSGNSGSTAGSTSAASGGSGNAKHGGDGGAGSAGTSLNGVDGSAGGSCGRNASSGGGGGGGAGTIYVFPAQTLGGSISPPPA
ncbi:MAG TPA: hypothetical protein VIV40_12250 [Kofleriaceae bacterium]